jgi:hypothetical protein
MDVDEEAEEEDFNSEQRLDEPSELSFDFFTNVAYFVGFAKSLAAPFRHDFSERSTREYDIRPGYAGRGFAAHVPKRPSPEAAWCARGV